MAGSKVMTIVLLSIMAVVRHSFAVGAEQKHPFSAPPMQPSQFLIISSPTEKKVVWTPLVNFRSSAGRAFALVDDGLSEPKGIAFDDRRGLLYVADSGAKAIFRYTVLIDVSPESGPQLKTTGVRLTIVQGQEVEWVTVDKEGDLFYTCPRTNNINKVSSEVMQNLADGKLEPSALHLISEKTLMKEVIEDNKKKALSEKLNPNHLPIDAPPAKPHILQIYEASLNPHVAAPASIRADNGELFWTNVANGTTAGTVVKAPVHPENATGNHSLNLSKPFPAEALTNISAGAYGLAKTGKAMFFTRNGTLPNTGVVSGILLSNPSIVLDFVKTIARPRGLVWDHDQTMYVTDQDAGCVWSFPIGRLMANAPLTKAVNINGAYDLRILSSTAPAFTRNEVTEVNRNG